MFISIELHGKGFFREYQRGKYNCTIDLLFDWFGISCRTTDNCCFYLQYRLIQTCQTGGQWYSDTSPFSIPWILFSKHAQLVKAEINVNNTYQYKGWCHSFCYILKSIFFPHTGTISSGNWYYRTCWLSLCWELVFIIIVSIIILSVLATLIELTGNI